MTVTLLRLVDGVRETVLHRPADPIRSVRIKELDVPSPAVRARTTERAADDGETDTTAYHGARAVNLTLDVFDAPMALVEEIGSYLHPAGRPWLVVADTEWAEQRALRLRVDQFGSPMPTISDRVRDVQLQWKAPAGVWQAWEPAGARLEAESSVVRGRKVPTKFPRRYPATGAGGQLRHLVAGTTKVHQVVRLYGPCVGPRWTNADTGESIQFTEQLVIPAGEYVEINTRHRTAYYLSDPNASRTNMIDYPNNTWWRLRPGVNQLRYHPRSGVDAGCAAELTYRPAWLFL